MEIQVFKGLASSDEKFINTPIYITNKNVDHSSYVEFNERLYRICETLCDDLKSQKDEDKTKKFDGATIHNTNSLIYKTAVFRMLKNENDSTNINDTGVSYNVCSPI